MCRHQYEYQGFRSSGGHIPFMADCSCFPGDEPGRRCRLSAEPCAKTVGSYPEGCIEALPTFWLCPNCQETGTDAFLYRHGAVYICENCRESYAEDELPHAVASLVEDLTRQVADSQHALASALEDAFSLRQALHTIKDKAEQAVQ